MTRTLHPRALVLLAKDSLPGRIIQAYGGHQISNYASSLAFRLLMSTFPLLVGILALLSTALHSAAEERQLAQEIASFFPSTAVTTVMHALTVLRKNTGILGIISTLGLLWSGSSIFSSLEWPLDTLYGVPSRSALRKRGMALTMTMVYVVAIPGTIVLTGAVTTISHRPALPIVLSLMVWTAVLLLMYRAIPNTSLGLRDVWKGALTAGVLLELLTSIWPAYIHLVHGFDSYGAILALFFVLATWMYFLARIFLLGVVINTLPQTNTHGKRQNAPHV